MLHYSDNENFITLIIIISYGPIKIIFNLKQFSRIFILYRKSSILNCPVFQASSLPGPLSPTGIRVWGYSMVNEQKKKTIRKTQELESWWEEKTELANSRFCFSKRRMRRNAQKFKSLEHLIEFSFERAKCTNRIDNVMTTMLLKQACWNAYR